MSDSLQIIPSKQIVQSEKLGEGGFGIVYKGTWDQHQVAIKRLRLHKLSDELKQEFLREARVMAGLNNPAIIRLYGICNEDEKYGMVLEFLPKGDLFQLLQSKQQLPWNPLRWQIAIDIASGLRYLHSKDILHRDLKSLNVLLTEHYRVKITDFGLSKLKFQTKSTSTSHTAGSIPWMAPELFKRGGKITRAIDIYAFGMVLWEIAARKLPFSDALNVDVIPTWIVKGEREEIPKDCPEKIGDLIKLCWDQEPETRPTAEAALETLTKARPQSVGMSIITQGQKAFQTQMVVVEAGEVSEPKEYDEAWKAMHRSRYQEALPRLLTAAAAKYPPAYIQLRHLYATSGYIGPTKPEEVKKWEGEITQAIKWYQEKAKTGDFQAQFCLGYCYLYGLGVEKDKNRAFDYFKEAAKTKDPEAQFWVGKCELFGWGTKKYKKPESLLLAANQNHANGQLYLAVNSVSWDKSAYENKLYVKDLQASANTGLATALYHLAEWTLEGRGVTKDRAQALRLYQQAAKKGLDHAQYRIGMLYLGGQGIRIDVKIAKKYFQSALEQGFEKARAKLAMRPIYADYVEARTCLNLCKYKDALPFLESAAKAKYPPAYLRLNWLYTNSGLVGPSNRLLANQWKEKAVESFSWFLEEAKTAFPFAQRDLGHCYYYGLSVRRDYEAAVKYYRLAAAEGDSEAELYLGHCYRYGHGVVKDVKYSILKLPSSLGHYVVAGPCFVSQNRHGSPSLKRRSDNVGYWHPFSCHFIQSNTPQ